MGNQHNVSSHHYDVNLSNKELEKYEKDTHYTKNEIKQLHKQFHDEVSSGYILQQDFHILTDMLGIKNQVISNILFHAYDLDGDNRISFSEFIHAMSTMSKGTIDEKLRFAFNMYDSDRDNYISKSEMTRVFNELYTMMGDLVSLQGELDTPSKLVDKIFSDYNTSKNGMLSFEEYKVGAIRDPSMMNPLNFM